MNSLEKAVSNKVLVLADDRSSKDKIYYEELHKDPVRLSNWLLNVMAHEFSIGRVIQIA